jgi:hypothetical protein
VGRHFEAAAIEAMAVLPQALNFLELQDLCVTVLNQAVAAGREKATIDDVSAATADRQETLPKMVSIKQEKTLTRSGVLKSVINRRKSSAIEEKKEAVGC